MIKEIPEIRLEQLDSQNQSELDKICTSFSNAFANTPETSSSQKNTEFLTPQQQIVSTKAVIETPEIISQDTVGRFNCFRNSSST